MLAAGVIMTTTPLFAQFNTVMPGRTTGVSESVSLKDDDMGNRQGKAFMEGCLSEEKSAPASSGEAGKEKWVKRYLSVCYPLRKMKVNSPYGYRTDPFTGKRKFHNGIDLHARGDKVLAMMEGTVIKVGQDRASGKYVVLRHGEFTVSYCHLSRILVGKGLLSVRGMRSALRETRDAAPASICTSLAGATGRVLIRLRFSITSKPHGRNAWRHWQKCHKTYGSCVMTRTICPPHTWAFIRNSGGTVTVFP